MKKPVGLALAVLLAALPVFAQERFRKSPPVPERLAELDLPRIDSIRLTNGLMVAVIYLKNLPFISAELTVLAGERDCPEDLPGLAGFTAEMLTRGTTFLSASDIEERIEGMGGALSTAATLDYTRFSLLCLDENLDRALELLSLMALQPALSDKDVASLRLARRYEMLREERNPEFVGRRQLLRLLFNHHPYESGLFNDDTFKNFSRKDVASFYQRYYRPNNALVVLAGNINLTAASRKVSRYFSTWQEKDVPRSPALPPEPNRDERVCLVDLPRAKDATVFVGNLVSPADAPDFFPVLVLNQVLGGTPNSRLFMNLRESKEFANYAFSEIECFGSTGAYEVRARVISSACYPAVQEILREIDRAGREKVTTFELEQAKSYLIGNFPLQIDRLEAITQRVSEVMTFSLGDAHWNNYYDSIMLVDADSVLEVGRRYMLPKPVVVIVGDKAALAEYLREFPRVEVYDIKGTLLYTMLKGVQE
jgi:zinc protease